VVNRPTHTTHSRLHLHLHVWRTHSRLACPFGEERCCSLPSSAPGHYSVHVACYEFCRENQLPWVKSLPTVHDVLSPLQAPHATPVTACTAACMQLFLPERREDSACMEQEIRRQLLLVLVVRKIYYCTIVFFLASHANVWAFNEWLSTAARRNTVATRNHCSTRRNPVARGITVLRGNYCSSEAKVSCWTLRSWFSRVCHPSRASSALCLSSLKGDVSRSRARQTLLSTSSSLIKFLCSCPCKLRLSKYQSTAVSIPWVPLVLPLFLPGSAILSPCLYRTCSELQ
jgi:hypothetical protein